MARLRQDYQEFAQRDAEIIAIGPEGPEAFAAWWRREQMPFTGIGDPKHQIAKIYGQQVKPLKFGRMPAMVVIDKQGRVRFQHYGESMSDIPSNEKILSLLDDLNRDE